MVNKYPSVRIVFDRKHLASLTRRGSVEIEISYNRKRKWIATGVLVNKNNWSPDEKVYGVSDALDLNLKIESKFNSIVQFVRLLQVNNDEFTWDGFSNFLSLKKVDGSFLVFLEESIRDRKDIKDSTKKNHRKLLVALKKFQEITQFSDLTTANILRFEDWLRSRKTYRQTTIASYHKFFKVYIHEALKRNYIEKNPYAGLSIDRGKSSVRKYLTPEEVHLFEQVELSTRSLDSVRDLFLFQCYTGIAYADLVSFDFNKVIERDGRYILNDCRKKNGEIFYIVLLPKAISILRKYSFNLPVISNQQYNLRLKLVANYARVNKTVTTHMARHTYASMCLNAGIKIEVLAQMLGHTDIKTTQIYAKMFNSTVEAAFDQLEQALSKQKNK
ncbi:MAG: site-specific integrase [Muribaculaceae bacterium]|nr:site-specific integrase [Muribaculaceae bacterium]